MAAPKLAKNIGIKVPAANIGEYVAVKNMTRGGQLIQKLAGTDRSIVFNPAPALQWQENDEVQAEMHGRLNGYARKKLQSGGTTFTLDLSADTSTPGVSL